jgi:hypothetical protein
VIELTLQDIREWRAVKLDLTGFWISGDTLWNPLLHKVIATYTGGGWLRGGRVYPVVNVAGGCSLVSGISRDPTWLSDPVELLTLRGPTLCANRHAFAQYVAQQDTWHGLIRPISWRALRVISCATLSAVADLADTLRLNPWESAVATPSECPALPDAALSPPDHQPLRSARGTNLLH